MFSKQLIDYTMSTFEENKISIATKTMVKEVQEKKIIAMNANKELVEYPFGLLVWCASALSPLFPSILTFLLVYRATGNTARPVTRDLMTRIGSQQDSRRGLLVDEHLRLLGADGVFALGDCTATNYAPTAQVATQQGKYLARVFQKIQKKEQLLDELNQAKSAGAEAAQLDSLANAVIRASNIQPFSYTHQGVSLAFLPFPHPLDESNFLRKA
jgi:NADH:ubiquinone reductase (non-electrogenic)